MPVVAGRRFQAAVRGRGLDDVASSPRRLLTAGRVEGVCQRYLSGRFSLRQPAHRSEHRPCSYRTGVEKLVFFGSSCIYPREAPAADFRRRVADRAAGAHQRGLRGRQDRRHQAVPGLPAAVRLRFHFGDADQPLWSRRQFSCRDQPRRRRRCLRRFHEAKMAGAAEVVVWGTGTPRREFLYVDDLADAALHLLRHYSGERMSISAWATT